MSTEVVLIRHPGELRPGDVVVEATTAAQREAAERMLTAYVRREILPPLPTLPGYYVPVGARTQYGQRVVVELLNRPERQWVDAGDRTYLSEAQVRDLLPLARLARVDHLLAEIAQIEVAGGSEVREQIRQGLDEIARRYGVPAYEVTE